MKHVFPLLLAPLFAAWGVRYFFPKLLNMVLGEEQKKRLYDHLRTEDGRVPTQAIGDAMEEIFAAAGDQSKNS